MEIRSRAQKTREKLTARQNLLIDFLCKKENHGECLVTIDELEHELGLEETSVIPSLQEDLRTLQGASFWASVEDGEELVSLVDKAEINEAKRTILVRLGILPVLLTNE